MYCTSCGLQVNDGEAICPSCGASMTNSTVNTAGYQTTPSYTAPATPSYTAPVAPAASAAPAYNTAPSYTAAPAYSQTYTAPTTYSAAESETPVSVGNWVGSMLLMLIPIVNIIMAIVWAVSGTPKSKRNFFRAYWILVAISVAISVIVMIVFGATFAAAMRELGY